MALIIQQKANLLYEKMDNLYTKNLLSLCYHITCTYMYASVYIYNIIQTFGHRYALCHTDIVYRIVMQVACLLSYLISLY